MEKITKELKSLSSFIGFMALLQVFNMLNTFNTLNDADIISSMAHVDLSSLGMTVESLVPVVKYMAMVPFVLSILVHIILSVKGHKEANDPSSAKAHIILAVIWIVVYALSTIGGVVELFNGNGDLVMKVLEVVISAASAMLLFYYTKLAKQVRTTEA